MSKITFIGAGSTVFAKNILGDCLFVPALAGFEFALYDIDHNRLKESETIFASLKRELRCTCDHSVVSQPERSLKECDICHQCHPGGRLSAKYCHWFWDSKKYGLRQTIADTVGIGGIFRSLRTIPVMLDFAKDMEEVCPHALLLNYTNPMATLTGAIFALYSGSNGWSLP